MIFAVASSCHAARNCFALRLVARYDWFTVSSAPWAAETENHEDARMTSGHRFQDTGRNLAGPVHDVVLLAQGALIVALLVVGTLPLVADNAAARGAEPAKAPAEPVEAPSAELTVEKLTETARKSVVVVMAAGRDGKRQGLGSGFVVSA